MPSIQYFPFGPGLHEENDNLLQNAGTPRAVENLIRTKNGRLCPRRDYETLGTTAQDGVSNLRFYDLAGFGPRLLAFGRCATNQNIAYAQANDATERIFELVEQPTHVWSRVPGGELGAGTLARKIGRVGRKISSITRVDVAAGSGLMCLVYELLLDPDEPTEPHVGIVILDPITDATITAFELNLRERPRVCCVGAKFFVTAIDPADGSVELFVYDPAASSALTQLTDLYAAGASVVAYDLATARAGTTFWSALARSNTTTQLRGCNNAGTITYTTAGPAILCDAISVLHHSTGGTDRLHVCAVRDTTLNIDLYTYLPPATVPATSSTDLLTPRNSITQPGLALDPDGAALIIYYQTELDSFGRATVFGELVNFTTHALSSVQQVRTAFQNGKSLDVRGRPLLPGIVEEEDGFFTHALLRMSDTVNRDAMRPVCVTDRFLGHVLDRVHLPSVAYDASTDLVYSIHCVEDEDRSASPQVLELRVAGTDRRQTVALGDVLYIAGAIVQAFDGRSAHEAGGFLTRPVIQQLVANGGGPGTGALVSGGTYQSIVAMAYRDAKNRRIQSAPSNLAEATDAGAQALDITFDRGVTLRDSGVADYFAPETIQSPPTVEIYRTLNTDDGNGTFHLDESFPARAAAQKGSQSETLTNSDDEISDNAILYTQGARGALSGPLEFVCPDPANSLAASADRILTGALTDETRIQESRPLFVAEQVQWSDTLGFYRDVLERVLAVVRLDERRIVFTANAIFELDGPGLDDNGIGDIGAPRRLPSDVGLYGGVHGWRSVVEISAGILFQGLQNQIYLLPRGGVTPVPVGFAVEDKLAEYPVIKAAVYSNEDQTVRFFCENEAGDESIVLLFNVRFTEWFVEGPYAFGIRSAARAAGRLYVLTSAGAVLRQLEGLTPSSFIATAWRSGVVHPFKPGMFGRVLAPWFYGTFRGNCRIRAIVRFGDGSSEEHEWIDVAGLEDGDPFVYRFEFDQNKCESCMVDFEVAAFQGEATRGLDYNYWALEAEAAGVPNQISPEEMS